ncbi:nucleolar complex protein 4 homolog [Tubulanus polymorphus]|uniref:nucleolar complex protein 4 homolog n=1 Tax=Tubulanus polymorphus TaxID=672921 RepID=UPI003DA26A90
MAASTKKHAKKIRLKNNKEIDAIKENASLFLANRKNSNRLIDILSALESDEYEVVVTAIKSIHRVFSNLIRTGQILKKASENDIDEKEREGLPKDDQYRLWLHDNYTDMCKKLLELLHHDDRNIQELSLCTLLKFVAIDGQHPTRTVTKKQLSFPSLLYQSLLNELLCSEDSMVALIERMQEYMEYDDVRFYTLKHSLRNMRDKIEKDLTEQYLRNLFTLLENISLPTEETEVLSKCLAKPPGPETNAKILLMSEQKRLFTLLWLEFLKQQLSVNIYKKVLVILHDKVMPYVSNPLLLSDFLTISYNIGGAVSLLALNGLFVLIQKYNLNYPDFYPKLYSLLDPSVFHVKYQARFFYLTDLFLTSTHLPAYLVAAFIKKLSRLALTAPASSLSFLIPLVYNLIIRHPTCHCLIHRTDFESIAGDPYVFEEKDPAKCNALDSSLWEIKTMQNHYHPAIVNEAMKLDNKLPSHEMDISEKLETTAAILFDRSFKKRFKEAPVTFQPPKGLFNTPDDIMQNNWLLE